jgi:hypothetical protein
VQEADVLQAVVDWVVCDPGERLSHLRDLLTGVRAEQLPSLALDLAPPPPAGQADDGTRAAVMQVVQEVLTKQQLPRATSSNTGTGGATTPVPSQEGVPAVSTPRNRPPTPGVPAAQSPSARRQHNGVYAGQQDLGGVYAGPKQLGTPPAAGSAAQAAPQHAAHRQHVARAFGRRRKYQATQLCAAGGHDDTWRSLKVGREGHRVWGASSRASACGQVGFCAPTDWLSHNHRLQLVEVYDPIADAWTPGPTMLHAVSFAGAALVDREVYVVCEGDGGGGMRKDRCCTRGKQQAVQ